VRRVSAVVLALLVAPATAQAMEPDVSVQYAAYQPARITTLAGDAVMWHNESAAPTR
jgi:plastocyanin